MFKKVLFGALAVGGVAGALYWALNREESSETSESETSGSESTTTAEDAGLQ